MNEMNETNRPGHTSKLQIKNKSNHNIYPPPCAILDEGIHGPLRSRRVFTAPAGWKYSQSWIMLSSLHLPLILHGKPMDNMEYPTTCKHRRPVFKSAKHGVSANFKNHLSARFQMRVCLESARSEMSASRLINEGRSIKKSSARSESLPEGRSINEDGFQPSNWGAWVPTYFIPPVVGISRRMRLRLNPTKIPKIRLKKNLDPNYIVGSR